MLFDIGLVIACHFITQNLALLAKDKPGVYAVAVRIGAIITITVGVLAIGDLIFKKISGLAG